MRVSVSILLIAAGLVAAAPAWAEHRICNVPLSDWQPREALATKLAAEGWQAIAIRTDDGCYKARAVNASGEKLDAKYDPATLEMVARRPARDAGHDHSGGHDDHED